MQFGASFCVVSAVVTPVEKWKQFVVCSTLVKSLQIALHAFKKNLEKEVLLPPLAFLDLYLAFPLKAEWSLEFLGRKVSTSIYDTTEFRNHP